MFWKNFCKKKKSNCNDLRSPAVLLHVHNQRFLQTPIRTKNTTCHRTCCCYVTESHCHCQSFFPLPLPPPPPLLPSLCDHSPAHSQQEKHTGVLLSALSHILPADVHTVHSCADKSINVRKRTEILAAYFFASHLCPHANNPALLFSLLLSPQTCNILQPKCFPNLAAPPLRELLLPFGSKLAEHMLHRGTGSCSLDAPRSWLPFWSTKVGNRSPLFIYLFIFQILCCVVFMGVCEISHLMMCYQNVTDRWAHECTNAAINSWRHNLKSFRQTISLFYFEILHIGILNGP